MRTDVKVGLICVFGIILAVVIYYVALSQNHPRAVQASDTAGTATTSPAGSSGGLQVAPAPAADNRNLSIASATSSDRMVAQVPTAGPGSGIGGPMIVPPSPSTPLVAPGSATPATSMPAPGSGNLRDLTGGTPMNSTPLIPSPTTGPASGFTGSSGLPSGSAPMPDHTIDNPSPGVFDGSRAKSSKFNGSPDGIGGSPRYGGFAGSTGAKGSASSTYTIAKGDMLGAVAKAKGVSLKALQAANPGVDSTKLKIGQVIKIPAPGDSAAPSSITTASTRPSRSTAHTAVATTPPSSGAAKPGSSYTVKKGDTLGKIAVSVYGDKNAWQRIFRANRGEISDANVLPVGTVLKLPS